MDENQLQELQELKHFYAEIKTRYTKSKKVLENIESFELRYSKAQESASEIVSETEETKNTVQSLQSQAKIALEQIQETRTSISGYLDAAKTNIEKLHELSTNAATLKGQIDGGKGEIDALLKNARNLTENIEQAKKHAAENLSSSDELLADFQQKAEQMKSAFVDFTEIKTKIDDKNTGLDAALKLVQTAQSEASSLVTEITQCLEVSQAKEKEIINIKGRSAEYLTDIETSLDLVNEKKSQVEEAAAITIDASFASKFESRKLEIENSLNKDHFSWKFILLWSIFFLALAVTLPFSPHASQFFSLGSIEGFDGFLIRIFYTSPFVFLVAFSATQYSRERTLLERYAFKAASASAIRNHTDFLVENFTSKEVKAFTLKVFGLIYGEPFPKAQTVEKQMIVKDTNNNINKNFDFLKELKELIPDEEKRNDVIDLIAKRF